MARGQSGGQSAWSVVISFQTDGTRGLARPAMVPGSACREEVHVFWNMLFMERRGPDHDTPMTARADFVQNGWFFSDTHSISSICFSNSDSPVGLVGKPGNRPALCAIPVGLALLHGLRPTLHLLCTVTLSDADSGGPHAAAQPSTHPTPTDPGGPHAATRRSTHPTPTDPGGPHAATRRSTHPTPTPTLRGWTRASRRCAAFDPPCTYTDA
jgi:hypothetical protein